MGKAVKAVAGAALTVVGFVTGNPYLIAAGVALVAATVLAPAVPKVSAPSGSATTSRLSKRLEPEAFRKIVFGETAFPADVRYWEVFGEDQSNYFEAIAAATHRVESFGELWIDDEIAVAADGTVSAAYAGVLERATVVEGQSGAGIPAGAAGSWTASSSMTGCAYYMLGWLYDQEKLPQGVPSRYTQRGKGAPVYDPRRDVSLGGTHDILDQSTWEYAPLDSNGRPVGRNNALQMLWYQVGWRINGTLVAGRGVDVGDLDLDSFIQAANDCEANEWYSDCALSTGDSHSTNEAILKGASGGQLLDTGGRIAYCVAVDDTANVALYLTDDDVVGGVSWVPRWTMEDQLNEIAGTFIDPETLFQPHAYPLVTDASYVAADGFRKRKTLNYSAVQDSEQAQRLSRIMLNRGRLQGTFQATFNYRSFKARNWSLVRLSLDRYGWENRLFRIVRQSLSPLGGITMVLEQEDSSVYLGGTVQTPLPPGAGVGDDPRTKIPVQLLTADAIVKTSTDEIMTVDGVRLSWQRPSAMVRRTEARYRKSGETAWQPGGTTQRGGADLDGSADTDSLEIFPLQTGSLYQLQVRHISIYDVPGSWSQVTETTGSSTSIDQTAVRVGEETLAEVLDVVQQGQDALTSLNDRLAQITMSNSARWVDLNDYVEGLTYVPEEGGKKVKTIVIEQKVVTADTVQTLGLIGVKNGAGNAFILDENTVKLSSDGVAVATRFSGITTNISANQAAIITESNARSTADSAFASSLTSVSTTVGGHTSSINLLFTSVNGIDARATLVVSGGGNISGWTASAGASGGSMRFLGNTFYFVDPGTGAATTVAYYSGGEWYFTNIRATNIAANTIIADHIVGGAITNVATADAITGASISVGVETTDLGFYYTSLGGEHVITFYGETGTGGTAAAGSVLRLRRNGTEVGRGAIYCPGSWGGVGLACPVSDQPGAGTHYYEVTYEGTASSGSQHINRSRIVLTELKR